MNVCLKRRSSEEFPCTPPSDSQRTIYETLLKRLKEEPLTGIVGPDYVTGSNLPSHSDIHISCLTGLKIQVQTNIRHQLYISIMCFTCYPQTNISSVNLTNVQISVLKYCPLCFHDNTGCLFSLKINPRDAITELLSLKQLCNAHIQQQFIAYIETKIFKKLYFTS